jgi:hypothetical protein
MGVEIKLLIIFLPLFLGIVTMAIGIVMSDNEIGRYFFYIVGGILMLVGFLAGIFFSIEDGLNDKNPRS